PFAGAIARRYKYPGDLITPASKSGDQPIFLIVNENELRVVINVPQSELSGIRLGESVDVQVAGGGAQNLPVIQGEVSRIDALLDESTKTQRVLIDLKNESRQLRAGMFVSVTVHRMGHDGVLTVPKESILMEGDKSQVLAVVAGKVKRVPVVTGV